MKVELKITHDEVAYILQNLWPLYQHDLSKYETSLVPNRHGLLGADAKTKTLATHVEGLASWWKAPEALFPYLILVNGVPAGFNLIAARSRLPEGIEADFVVHEFFVLHAYRGGSVAEQAAIEGFNRHPGKWEVVTWPTHQRAIRFWRRVIGNYASNGYSEEEVDHPWGRRVAFQFDHG